MNVRKSAGCDLMPGKLIKEGAKYVCKPIQSLITDVLTHVRFLMH